MAKDDSPEAKEEEDNPFPFKISGVMSLAEETVPPLSPIKEKQSPKVESVILKEAKMNAVEKAATWKCAEAVKKFINCPKDLYKCPQFFCKYATSWRHLFEGHIKAHARVNDELVSCVYCDVKTPLSHAGLHIDLRHSNCLYSCSQCLYRALTREYVMIHNRLKHKENDSIIALPPKTAKTIMMSKQKRFTVKDACPAYRCGYDGCNTQFLFLNEFCAHLETVHDGIMVCGFLNNGQRCSFQCLVVENMIDHWRTHSCYNYHCLLCKIGCMEVYTMLEHYSSTHPNMEPMVVDRRTSPTGFSQTFGYSDDGALKVRFIKEELLESVNVQQITIVSAPDSQQDPVQIDTPSKSVTLLPISVFQSASAETKKLIAILPKVDAPKLLPPPPTSPSFVFASTEDLTSKDKEEEPKDPIREEESDNGADNSADPLSLDAEMITNNMVSASGDESDFQEVVETGEMKSFGLIGYQLYRCAFCDISFSNARDFKTHTMHSKQCKDGSNAVKPFKCVHCQRMFKNPHGLLEHVQYHGQLRYGCSLCVKKFPSSFSLKLHMRSKHNVTNTISTPVVPHKTNPERDEFVLRPVSTLVDTEIGKDGPLAQSAFNVVRQKAVYGPDEIDQLPKRYIFNSDVKCALCSYSTKVRTNLVRHLQFHSSEKSVPDIAPVNPVPCLDKNERMFDKMTNLAISSMGGATVGRMGGGKQETRVKEELTQIPAYVPSNRRYVCCAEGCNYLCLEEANLRHHIDALHLEEPSFVCAHCKLNLKTDIDAFLKHLKLHELHLYKCYHCSYVHNLRHKVDKHSADKHPENPTSTITIRALEAELIETEQSTMNVGVVNSPMEPPLASNIKWTKPWHCGMCKYRCAAKNDIINHIFNKHDMNAQYKCTLCSYKTDEKHTFDVHFKENHLESDIDIIYVYYKSEGAGQTTTTQKQFDTTPLWQRDRPRVRHIRGILFEESSSSPVKVKKAAGGRGAVTTPSATITRSLSPAPPASLSNLDIAIDAVAKGTDNATKKEPPVVIKSPPTPVKETPSTSKIDDSVIIIEDDDDDDDDDDDGVENSKLDESGDHELMIDIDEEGESSQVGGDSVQVKAEERPEFLSEEILCKRYGTMCAPVAKTYKCPLCNKYRNKRVSSFVHHVLTEMKCYRFKCKVCDFASVTFDSMVGHCQERHNSVIAANVEDTPIDKTVEYWLQILIQYQSKTMVPVVPSLPSESSGMALRTKCDYCDKCFKNVHLLKDHELYHWADHGYKCDHCLTEFTKLNELFQHTFMTHPSFDVSFTTNGPYVGKLIATLKTPMNLAPPQTTPVVDEIQFSCTHCSEVAHNLDVLRKHANEFHEGEEFVYKVVSKTRVDPLYCCSFCHERGSEKFLKDHHKEKHEALKYTIYQYICLECSKTFLNIKDLRTHFLKIHTGKKLTYSCIENKLGGAKDQYCCPKCPFRSCSVGGIRNHVRKHLRPIDCLTCGATFIYPTEGRAHHGKEHMHAAERVEENKEKLKEYEDLVQQIVAAKDRGEPPAPAAQSSSPPPVFVAPTPPAPSVSTATHAPPPRKMLARKSTGAPFIRDTSSHLANKKEDTDLKTSIE